MSIDIASTALCLFIFLFAFTWFKQRYAWADVEPAGAGAFVWQNRDGYVRAVHELGGRLIVQLAAPSPHWARVGATLGAQVGEVPAAPFDLSF